MDIVLTICVAIITLAVTFHAIAAGWQYLYVNRRLEELKKNDIDPIKAENSKLISKYEYLSEAIEIALDQMKISRPTIESVIQSRLEKNKKDIEKEVK